MLLNSRCHLEELKNLTKLESSKQFKVSVLGGVGVSIYCFSDTHISITFISTFSYVGLILLWSKKKPKSNCKTSETQYQPWNKTFCSLLGLKKNAALFDFDCWLVLVEQKVLIRRSQTESWHEKPQTNIEMVYLKFTLYLICLVWFVAMWVD